MTRVTMHGDKISESFALNRKILGLLRRIYSIALLCVLACGTKSDYEWLVVSGLELLYELLCHALLFGGKHYSVKMIKCMRLGN